jgi:predicted permease
MATMLDALRRDLRASIRLLAARPGWSVAAILCLAIATGANTAAFTIINGLLLRPLPFDAPDRLVMVALREPRQGSTRPFALREYRELAEQSTATSMLLARTFFPLSLVASDRDDGARMAQAELVSGNYFETLGVAPFLGRFFDERAGREGSPLLAVLSHRLWQRRFGSDPGVIGKTVRVNGRSAIVAAVTPPGFVGAMQLVAADLWLPAAIYPDLAGSARADTTPMFGVMGRLAADITADEAESRLTALAAVIELKGVSGERLTVIVQPAGGFGVPVAAEGMVLTISGFIYVMMSLLMAVACANVAALVLARGVGRSREIAVRLSLGASRMHIARQLLTESIVLALAGCAAGVVVALWLTQALVARLSTPFQYVSYAIDVHPDARVFAYSAIATAVAAALCAIAPIRLAGRVDVADVIKQSAASGRSRRSMRSLNAMVVVQFAVSTTLLVAAGMLVRTYMHAQSSRPNFETTGLVAATLDLDQLRIDRAAGIRMYQMLIERLSAVPGVTGVTLTRDVPARSSTTVAVYSDASSPTAAPSESARVMASAAVVSTDFFRTLGLTVRQGRSFEPRELARPLEAVINEAMAQRLWPNGSAVGRTFSRNDRDGARIEVIGVVANTEKGSATRRAQPAFYLPFPQEYGARMTVLMRVHGAPSPFFTTVRQTVRDLDRDLAIVDMRTMDDLLDDLAHQQQVPATVLTLVAGLGLLLSAVGLYGVVAYGVRERAHELGIRLALGARPVDVRRLVFRQGFTIVGIGLAIGVVGTTAIAQVLRNRLFGAAVMDPTMLLAVGAVLLAASFTALYLPARWGSALEPAQTLRSE